MGAIRIPNRGIEDPTCAISPISAKVVTRSRLGPLILSDVAEENGDAVSMVLTKECKALARACEFELLATWIESVHSIAGTTRMEANSARETAALLRAETRRMRVESGRAVSRSTTAREARHKHRAAPHPAAAPY